MTLESLTDEERVLLEKKFAQFKRLPKESNNVCPNYYNPYHDPRNCPGSCRYCLWDGCSDRGGSLKDLKLEYLRHKKADMKR